MTETYLEGHCDCCAEKRLVRTVHFPEPTCLCDECFAVESDGACEPHDRWIKLVDYARTLVGSCAPKGKGQKFKDAYADLKRLLDGRFQDM